MSLAQIAIFDNLKTLSDSLSGIYFWAKVDCE